MVCIVIYFPDGRGTLDGQSRILMASLCARLDMAKMIHYEDEEKQRAHEAVDIGGMERELALTEGKSTQLGSPIVWSHNDLLSGNVLVSKQVQHLVQPVHAIYNFFACGTSTEVGTFWYYSQTLCMPYIQTH